MARLFIGNTHVKLDGRQPERAAVHEALSYVVPNHKIIARRQYQRTGQRHWLKWNGVKSFFDGRSNLFLTGLLGLVLKALEANGMAAELIDTRPAVKQAPALPSPFRLHDPKLRHITLHDYQERACNAFLKACRGTLKLATGAGKTECAIALVKHLNLPTLFLTHRVNLLHQTAERFSKRLNLPNAVGIIGDSIYEPRFVTIATVQTLHAMIKRDPAHAQKELAHFQFLIIDEAHRTGASQFHETAAFALNAYYRLALTATPFMAGDADSYYLMGTCGPTVAEITNAELITRGILARPFFSFIDINQPADMGWLTNWRDIYEVGIINNKFRNQVVTKKTAELVGMGKKPLVILREVKHGNLLRNHFLKAGLKARFIHGANAYSERATALAQLAGGAIDVIIATNIFDEGIDVKDINAIVMAAGSKSAPALFQRAGRAIRRKESDNYAVIVDFIDRQHPKLFEHSAERYRIVKNESGFVIL